MPLDLIEKQTFPSFIFFYFQRSENQVGNRKTKFFEFCLPLYMPDMLVSNPTFEIPCMYKYWRLSIDLNKTILKCVQDLKTA